MISLPNLRFFLLSAVIVLCVAASSSATPQLFTLHTFTGDEGDRPFGPLVFDSAGNLYGNATGGGTYNRGVVFMLTNNAGVWNYSVLYNFAGPDGSIPVGQLAFDSSGNIYGATASGGAYGSGTVFKLSFVNGRWFESNLYSFTGTGRDGGTPAFGVVLDAEGSLYTTSSFGAISSGPCANDGCGAVIKLVPTASGTWKRVILHTFKGKNDGGNPQYGLTLDGAGNLYGTCIGYGRYGFGTAFELSRGANWPHQSIFRLLHSFQSVFDGAYPTAGLVFDKAGNAYGGTTSGGADGSANGTLFELVPTVKGQWKFNLLYTFTEDSTSGPNGTLVIDAHDNLYGGGSVGAGFGGVFELSPAGGSWNYSVVYTFSDVNNGAFPFGVILDSGGNMFGTTNEGGGPANAGTVFEIVP